VSNQTEWRWADPTGQQRLVREDELRAAIASGVIPANAPVWTRGWSGWKPAHDVPELNGKATTSANGDLPPPPNFIVDAQHAFEGKPKPAPAGPAEPPPPPRYVPFAAGSDTKVDAPVINLGSDSLITAVPTQKATPAKPKTAPPPLPPKATSQQAPAMKKSTAPPPLPPAARKNTPGQMAAVKPQVSTAAESLAKTAPSVGTTTKPIPAKKPQQPQSTFTKTERPPMGVAPPSELLGPPSQSRSTLQIGVAPPPMMPKLDPLPSQREAASAKEPSSKFPTLVMFGDEPSTVSGVAPPPTKPVPPSEDAPPIVVPPPEPSEVKNAVTRPPPWGEGAVQMDTAIPKSPKAPVVFPQEQEQERPSEAPRPQELSSSDLTSEARVAVVKAAPLMAADRPRTMMGLGPDALADNRAALEKAVSPPPAPLSTSDVASTKELPAADVTEPKMTVPSPSGAKLHDLREIAKQRATGVVEAVKRGYASLEERTQGKPRWVLPTVLGVGTLVLSLLVMVGIKAITGSSETSPTASASGSASTHGSAQPTGTAKSAPARPIECNLTKESRSVAPKAVVSSGVEVTAIGSQLALGFAITPKEATMELLDPATLNEASALHLRSNDNVRRVVSVDSSKAIVDADRKGDRLQGRRTVRGATLVDIGAADGGLAWAPHGSDKAIKLWALDNADAPIEALRGEPLPNGKGTAVAFRQAGSIFFGVFGGSPPAPLAGLIKIAGLGPVIGSPALAASGDRVMVAWADRATKDDPWMVRWATFHPGESTATAKPFALPPGGLGDQVMSPGLASLGAGRFFIVWTEGAVSNHQVRGAVMGENGISGDPVIASADGANAGQGQVAVNDAGKGVIAFLVGSGKQFEIAATPIQCVEK
jgi:hypothetical protein